MNACWWSPVNVSPWESLPAPLARWRTEPFPCHCVWDMGDEGPVCWNKGVKTHWMQGRSISERADIRRMLRSTVEWLIFVFTELVIKENVQNAVLLFWCPQIKELFFYIQDHVCGVGPGQFDFNLSVTGKCAYSVLWIWEMVCSRHNILQVMKDVAFSLWIQFKKFRGQAQNHQKHLLCMLMQSFVLIIKL